MTVLSSPSKYITAGNGATTAFSFNSPLFRSSDLVVIVANTAGVETTQTEVTHYTVTINGDFSGATVNFVTAPELNYEVILVRRMAITQQRELGDTAYIDTEEWEKAFDEAALRDRELYDKLEEAFSPTGEGSLAAYDVGGKRITNAGDPTSNQDVATRIWVSTQVAGAALDSTVADIILAAAAQTTPVDANEVGIVVSGVLKRLSWANIKATLKAYFDTLYTLTADLGALALLSTAPVANGGTGSTTAAGARTNLGLVIGTDVAPSSVYKRTVITSTQTWTPQSWTKTAVVRIWGAGGGGAAASSNGVDAMAAAAGGGAGAHVEHVVANPTAQTVTIGAAGTAAATTAANGGTGGTTSFGTAAIAPGGVGATSIAGANTFTLGEVPLGGVPSTGDLLLPGAPGNPGSIADGASAAQNEVRGGNGGSTAVGGGGLGGSNGAGSVAVGYGSGGGGAAAKNTSGSSVAGGAGAPGLCIIEEYA